MFDDINSTNRWLGAVRSAGRQAAMAIVAGLVLTVAPGATLAEEPIAGFIQSYAGDKDDYEVLRADTIARFGILAPIRSGDQLVVKKKGGAIKVKLSSGERLTLRQSDSPYTVPAAKVVASKSGKLLAAMSDQLTNWHGDKRRKVSLISRTSGETDPLSMPMLDRDGLKFGSGRRQLAFVWLGGQAPYQITVTRVGESQPVLTATSKKSRHFSSKPLKLSEGQYMVKIADKNGAVSQVVTVVEATDVPVFPDENSLRELDSEVNTLLNAYWLAGQDNGAWVLESYARVASIKGRSAPARTLRQALSQGELPSVK